MNKIIYRKVNLMHEVMALNRRVFDLEHKLVNMDIEWRLSNLEQKLEQPNMGKYIK